MLEKLIKTAEASKEDLMVNAGYEEIVIGDFYDIFLEELNKLKEVAKEDAQKHCMELMSNHDQANYIIMYIRWLTALYLKKNAILFEAYIFEFGDIHSFCQREVEQLDVEADQPQIMAITSYLELGVEINSVSSIGAIHK
jgi:hypothetical protein